MNREEETLRGSAVKYLHLLARLVTSLQVLVD